MASATTDNHDQWHSGECWNHQHSLCIEWTVPIRYQNMVYISQGKFGAVMQATDTKTNKLVAIKKLFRPFCSSTHSKRTYRELRLLQHLHHHDMNVVQLYNVFTPETTFNKFNSIYFVLNFFVLDLDRMISQKQPFTEDNIRQIIYSILRGLKFLHSANIMHRDITPKNIGISQNYDVAILDLGLARVNSDGLKTGYVVARWWRAPEVMISWEHYDNKIDIWSVGCIMAELLRLKPLFRGKGSIEQLNKIIHILGTPSEQELKELCFKDARLYIMHETPNVPPTDFHTLFPTLSEQGIDFLQQLLRFDPRQRPTAAEALARPFLATHHDPNSEPNAPVIEGLYDDAQFSITRWKQLTWQLIRNFSEPT